MQDMKERMKKVALVVLSVVVAVMPAACTSGRAAKECEEPITMNLYYSGTKGSAKKFAQEVTQSGLAGAIRAEKGNLKYEYFAPMGDDDTILLIDSWKDQQALDMHHASPMMKKIAELREKYDLHTKAERYLPDSSKNSVADRRFLRE